MMASYLRPVKRVDARLQLAAQIGRVVVQPAAEQLDVNDVG